jgi:hypothetical protein
MKQFILRATILVSVLLVAASCNDDDDNGGNSTPAPQASFSGELTNPSTGEVSTWTADEVTAQLGIGGDLTIKARRGSDTLSLRVPTFEVRQYAIAFDEPFAQDNGYIVVTSTDTLVYGYRIGDFDGGGVLSITSIDSVNMRFDGDIAGLQFFNVENGPDENDQFILQNVVLSNIPYTIEEFDLGDPVTGTLSLVADGTPINFPNVTGFNLEGAIFVGGAQNAQGAFPSFSMLFDETTAPGTYAIGPNQLILLTYNTSENVNYTPQDGEFVVVTNANNTIQGTFFFTGEDSGNTIDITDGLFNINY